MKMKKMIGVVLAAGMVMMTACGGGNAADGSNDSVQNAGGSAAGDHGTTASQKGYVFSYKGTTIAVDQDMTDVLKGLGEAMSYFEAPSCAFEGLDKVYTYNGFVIDTYPQGEQDLVSAISLTDDVVTTPEGVYNGCSLADVTAAYGADYTEEGGMVVYKKDGMKLCFIVQDDTVTSIQYLSTVLDE